MGKSASKSKNSILLGQPTKAQIDELSKKFNLSVQRINLLKQKYNMYCSSNGKINIHNYLIIYREFINANATDVEIYKSFNGFDADRDGYLNFIVRFLIYSSSKIQK
jgi:Ca2+-binding EF-hand superfamily protein